VSVGRTKFGSPLLVRDCHSRLLHRGFAYQLFTSCDSFTRDFFPGTATNGIFNPANSTAMIAMMAKEHRGFASVMNHVTFGFGRVFGVALGGLPMSLAFEHYTGVPTTSLATENPSGFVSALNTTFLAAISLTLIALITSATRGDR
jgi:hypothetical protein